MLFATVWEEKMVSGMDHKGKTGKQVGTQSKAPTAVSPSQDRKHWPSAPAGPTNSPQRATRDLGDASRRITLPHGHVPRTTHQTGCQDRAEGVAQKSEWDHSDGQFLKLWVRKMLRLTFFPELCPTMYQTPPAGPWALPSLHVILKYLCILGSPRGLSHRNKGIEWIPGSQRSCSRRNLVQHD